MENSKRFKCAFEYLKNKGLIHSKAQLATKMGYSRSVVSNAYNGNDDYANEKFLGKFCETFPDIFNYEWLARGEGDMLVDHTAAPPEMAQGEKKSTEQTNVSSDIIHQLVQQNAALIELLKTKESSMERVVSDIEQIKKELTEISSKIKAAPYEYDVATVQSILNENNSKVYITKKEKQG